MKYIVVSEDARSAQELIAAAKAQGAADITAIQFSAAEAETVAKTGISGVVVAELAEDATKEAVAAYVVEQAKAAGSAVVLTSTSRRMVCACAAIAAGLGTSPVIDAKTIAGAEASHMKFGGKAIITERISGDFAVYAVSAGGYEAVQPTEAPCTIETIAVAAPAGVRVIERKQKEVQSVDLGAAKTIVCVGRGVTTREGFEKCVELQKAVRGEMACTRPITETEDPFMPRETYVGASGLFIKPDLYIGIAISGQTQHTMGMYESGKVVVIDKNKDALFFNMCDYGIVGDYLEVVPAITKALGA